MGTLSYIVGRDLAVRHIVSVIWSAPSDVYCISKLRSFCFFTPEITSCAIMTMGEGEVFLIICCETDRKERRGFLNRLSGRAGGRRGGGGGGIIGI